MVNPMEGLLDWADRHELVLAWLAAGSFLLFIGTLLAIPLLIVLMPSDYLVQNRKRPFRRSPLRQTGHILKNVLGGLLILAGLLMLVLPGQGLLTIAIGLSLLDFPGKLALQIRLVQIPRVRRTIEWIRGKASRPPLQFPDASPPGNPPGLNRTSAR